MTLEEAFRYIASLVGGGLAVAIGNWVHSNRSARRERAINYLEAQLRLLYGPLSYFTKQNEELFQMCNKVQDAHGEYFTGKWSDHEDTQKHLGEMSNATTDLNNAYIERVLKNNDCVMAVLEANWHLVDPDDMDTFSRFQVDYTRFVVEVKPGNQSKVPLSIVMKLGPISYMRPEFISRVNSSFQEKQTELENLRRR